MKVLYESRESKRLLLVRSKKEGGKGVMKEWMRVEERVPKVLRRTKQNDKQTKTK